MRETSTDVKILGGNDTVIKTSGRTAQPEEYSCFFTWQQGVKTRGGKHRPPSLCVTTLIHQNKNNISLRPFCLWQPLPQYYWICDHWIDFKHTNQTTRAHKLRKDQEPDWSRTPASASSRTSRAAALLHQHHKQTFSHTQSSVNSPLLSHFFLLPERPHASPCPSSPQARCFWARAFPPPSPELLGSLLISSDLGGGRERGEAGLLS